MSRKPDVMDRLTAARPEGLDPVLDPRRRARDLHNAMTGSTESGGRPGVVPRRARRTALVLAVAGGVAAATLTVTAVEHDDPAVPRGPLADSTDLSARTVLLSAAESTEKAAVRDGAYWMTYEQQGQATVVGAAGSRYVIERRSQLKQWAGLGRRPSWQSVRELGARPQTRQDMAAWVKAGSPARWNLPRPFEPWTARATGWTTTRLPVQITFAYGSAAELRSLPDDPAGLRAALLRRKNDSEGSLSETEWLYSSACELLLSEPVTVKVRAAAYRMLSDLPGIRMVGRTTDPLGRKGVGVALGDGTRGAGNAATERRLIVDPSTGRLLAEETVLVRPGKAREVPGRGVPIGAVARPGTVLNYRATLQATWTDSAP